jgi:hypothetical protein
MDARFPSIVFAQPLALAADREVRVQRHRERTTDDPRHLHRSHDQLRRSCLLVLLGGRRGRVRGNRSFVADVHESFGRAPRLQLLRRDDVQLLDRSGSSRLLGLREVLRRVSVQRP